MIEISYVTLAAVFIAARVLEDTARYLFRKYRSKRA